MRAFLILCVLVFTLMTFYSALWYKSEEIQADITTRVTQDLSETDATDVAVDVDGRHVTLTGIVYNEAAETNYLDTANNTYGALGPIDGLSFLSGGGFVNAVKSDAGITLNGSVPSEDARASLVAAAAEAADGDVTDNLSIGGAKGDWQGEARYGLAQMAGLSAGALAVTPDSYTLSGTAQDDATSLQQELSSRAGWQAFISSPAIAMGLSDEVSRLNADVSNRDQTIAEITADRTSLSQSVEGVTAERDTLATSLAAITAERATVVSERDTVTGELETLRASLDDNQSNAASLAADLEAANTGIANRDSTINDLNTQITGLSALNGTLEDQLAAQQTALKGDQEQVAALQGKVAVQTATIKGLTSDLDERSGQLAKLQGDLDNLGSTDNAAAAKIAELTVDLTRRDEQEARLDGEVADLKGRLESSEGQVADLTGKLADSAGQVATLQGRLDAQGSGNVDAATRIAALTANVTDQTAKTEILGKKIDDLTAVIATRDATIASLQNVAPVTTSANVSGTANQCSTRAGKILENAQINFATATDQIEKESVETLERLTGIALACAGEGLTVEVGGHTDSQGTDENNQSLSERRAQAIVAFMSDRGVPTDGLNAVGFGESNPIADNATAEGRAQNRRISLEWQVR